MNSNGVEEIELSLDDVTTGLGELKSDLPTQIQTVKRSNYTVSIRRLYEVHGKFQKTGHDEASLLVWKFSPKVKGENRRFTTFKVTLRFELSSQSDNNDDPPYIVSYAPAQDGAVFFSEHLTTVTRETSIQGSLSAQPPAGGASVGLTATKAKTEESERRELNKLSSESHQEGDGRGDNVVSWWMNAPNHTNGVGDSIAVAVLVKRAARSHFVVHVTVDADVGFKARVSNKWQDLIKGKSTRLGPYGPGIGVQSKPDGIDDQNLHEASTKNLLDQLAFVHAPEKAAVKKFYSDATIAVTPPPVPTPAATAPPATSPSATVLPATAPSATAPSATALPAITLPATTLPATALQEEQSNTSILSLRSNETVLGSTATTTKGAGNTFKNPSDSIFAISGSRAARHRKMAALYSRIAQLHREEAEEWEALDEARYADSVEAEPSEFA